MFFNPPLLAEVQVQHRIRLLGEVRERGGSNVEPVPEAESAWMDHVNEIVSMTLLGATDSWWMGTNIPCKPKQVIGYFGG